MKVYFTGILFFPLFILKDTDKPLQLKKLISSKAVLAWFKDQYDTGASMNADSLLVNKESERLLNKQYRDLMYQEHYTWENKLPTSIRTNLLPPPNPTS